MDEKNGGCWVRASSGIYVNCINRGKQLAILRLYIIYFPEQKHQHHDKIMIYTV